MRIAPFKVEMWMNAWETGARYNIAETCVDSVSLDELFALSGEDKQAFLDRLCAKRLTYGFIEGNPAFKEGSANSTRPSPRPISFRPMGQAGRTTICSTHWWSQGTRWLPLLPPTSNCTRFRRAMGPR